MSGRPGSRAAGVHRYSRLDEVIYGRPSCEVVMELCERWGAERVALLSTRSLRHSLCSALERALGPRHAATFAGFGAHTPAAAVLEAVQVLRPSGARVIVAVGGGSVIDGAKAVVAALRSGASSEAELFAASAANADSFPPVALVAVPTTLSGAEFTGMAGVTDMQGRKRRLGGPGSAPRAIVLDPEAALHTPRLLWTSTGMRALDHAIETVCSDHCDVLSEAMALRALPQLAQGLLASAAAGADVEARLQCQIGMWFACVGPSAGVPMGISHGIGHILGAEYGLAHGITSCVMMTAAIAWNRPAVLERQQRIEAALGLPGDTLMQQVDGLLQRLALPRRLSDVGIGEEAFAAIAERSMTDFFIPTNPRLVRSAADLLDVLRMAA
ncbi:MAG: iron-containing alcohol dehydrogenase [Burkholderiales bacterium]|nr:iron-containing alcohol dehydrogenase [Burkholderiales bacterium]